MPCAVSVAVVDLLLVVGLLFLGSSFVVCSLSFAEDAKLPPASPFINTYATFSTSVALTANLLTSLSASNLSDSYSLGVYLIGAPRLPSQQSHQNASSEKKMTRSASCTLNSRAAVAGPIPRILVSAVMAAATLPGFSPDGLPYAVRASWTVFEAVFGSLDVTSPMSVGRNLPWRLST